MARVLDYVGTGCLTKAPRTAITWPVDGGAFNTVPDFGGTAVGRNPIERVEVQIRDPGGRHWDGQSWVTMSSWLTVAGTSTWSYPLPLTVFTGTSVVTTLQQGEHQLWARAWDTAALSDTTPAFASFVFDTLSPTQPILVAPADGITVAGAPTGFLWRGPVSDTGSNLGYDLQIDNQLLTQDITGYVPSVLFATGVHTWRVRAFDAAGNRSSWTQAWTFYVRHYHFYLPLVLKNDQPASPPVCNDVVTNGGFETDDGWVINMTPVPAAYTSERFYLGGHSVRLGIVPPMAGDGSISYSSVDQTIPVLDGSTAPSSGAISATLAFWLYPINENGDDGDLQYVGLYDQEGTWSTLWSGRLDTQDWITRELDLTPYVGQVIRLRFSVKNDGDADNTAVYVDDVRLEVCGQ
jgi:hypothetical protein